MNAKFAYVCGDCGNAHAYRSNAESCCSHVTSAWKCGECGKVFDGFDGNLEGQTEADDCCTDQTAKQLEAAGQQRLVD